MNHPLATGWYVGQYKNKEYVTVFKRVNGKVSKI